ncbi:MAG: glycosyltransferase, partial [Planctomycetaceae bacterium]|nr:glycosyltransferase [Planctomycetaceae bacterium]
MVIPVYNAEKYLQECLDFIMNQTYSNLQIICINDGSTDNCSQILDEYAAKDSRFQIVCQQNTGQGIAKFNVLPLIRGKYTMTVDADDWIDLNAIEKCVRIAQEKDADVVVFTPDKRNEDGTKNDDETAHCLRWQFAVSVNDDNIATNKSEVITTYSFWGKLFLTELLLTNFTHPGNGMAEDCVVLWQVIPAAKRIIFLPENLYHYRIVSTSYCNTIGKHHLDSLNNCRIIYEQLVKRGQYQEYRDCFLRFLLSAISCNFYRTSNDDRYEFLRQFRTLLTREMKDNYCYTPLWKEHRCWLKKYGILEDNNVVFDKRTKIALAEDDIDKAKEKIRKLKGKHKPVKTILVDTARWISRRIFGVGTIGNFISRIKYLLSGIKRNLIYLFSEERIAYSRFLTVKVRPHSVLLIEPNECHGVVIPGYAKYLSDLGYNVDILMTTEEAKLDATVILTQPQYRHYVVTWNNMRDIIEKQIKYNDYAVWFFTSSVIYNWERSQRQVWCTVNERFPNLPLDKTVFVSHHKECNDSELLRSDRLIMLADFLEGAIVVPHYFGNVNITPKNDVTKFFVIGTVYPNRRNFLLLFSAVEQLAKQQQAFTITAIGEGFGELQIPQSIR